MTQFRIVGNGNRRQLGDGAIRSIKAEGSRYFETSGTTGLGISTDGAAIPSIPMVGQTWLTMSMSGDLTYGGTVGHTQLSIGVSGVLSASVGFVGASLIGFNLIGQLTAGIGIAGSSTVAFNTSGLLVRSYPIAGVSSLSFVTAGTLNISAVLRGSAGLSFTTVGTLGVKASNQWKELWENAYDKRQKVLNAVDANNRFLAKAAGTQATATANALVQTNTRVTAAEGNITAVASRVTLVEAALPGKANASALNALSAEVTLIDGKVASNASAITAVSASVDGKNSTYVQDVAPTGTTAKPLVVNDLWIQPNDGNRLRRWTGSMWQATGDNRIGATASAVQILEAEVSELGPAKATWGVYLTAGNLVSGVQSINDGTIAEFNVSANVFRLISPAGADGMEIQQGYIRVWKGSSQTIIGNNFGASGQNLIRWFGPNIGADACTKANATIWEDSAGNAYFGGQVLQGVLRFFNSNTTVSPTATVETGMNASNGKLVAVQGRFEYEALQSYPNFASNITLAGGSTVATVVVERMYAGGSWVELVRRNIIGNAAVNNENDGPSTIQWAISGMVMATDAATTTSRNYRTRVISISQQDYTVTNPGTVPAVVKTQYQAIESME